MVKQICIGFAFWQVQVFATFEIGLSIPTSISTKIGSDWLSGWVLTGLSNTTRGWLVKLIISEPTDTNVGYTGPLGGHLAVILHRCS